MKFKLGLFFVHLTHEITELTNQSGRRGCLYSNKGSVNIGMAIIILHKTAYSHRAMFIKCSS